MHGQKPMLSAEDHKRIAARLFAIRNELTGLLVEISGPVKKTTRAIAELDNVSSDMEDAYLNACSLEILRVIARGLLSRANPKG